MLPDNRLPSVAGLNQCPPAYSHVRQGRTRQRKRLRQGLGKRRNAGGDPPTAAGFREFCPRRSSRRDYRDTMRECFNYHYSKILAIGRQHEQVSQREQFTLLLAVDWPRKGEDILQSAGVDG